MDDEERKCRRLRNICSYQFSTLFQSLYTTAPRPRPWSTVGVVAKREVMKHCPYGVQPEMIFIYIIMIHLHMNAISRKQLVIKYTRQPRPSKQNGCIPFFHMEMMQRSEFLRSMQSVYTIYVLGVISPSIHYASYRKRLSSATGIRD